MSPRTCPDCGFELPSGLPEGSCPNCLLKLGINAALTDHAVSGDAKNESTFSNGAKSGDCIGRYKLLELIGQGGFGTVWMAEQHEPVRRKVALKVIKLGMDTQEVVARFEAERQALALMDHPNIARVFDGGSTESGRPYFVMELVRGVRITEYCDAHRFSTEERLRLFMQVCEAVQHAHQKGVIHRDLKPSNVLVTEQDGRGVPKVIDFGIAKATEQELTEETFFTRFNQLIGTPAYMSPEQAGSGNLDVDTRSDVYSLGVLLYELLTGRTPFSSQELHKAGLDQVLRVIREKEPLKPSTQLSTLTRADLEMVAQRRGAEPAKLNRLIRGDLDWIVMKCLEKDRARRYETAIGLARDVERHLQNEPVIARSPSALYRVCKAIRRNRLAFAATVLVFASLTMGLGFAGWRYLRERAALREQERLRQLAEGNLQIAREAADRMLTGLAEELKDQPHLIGLSRKLLEDALEFHEGFRQQKQNDPETLHALAQSDMRVGEIYQRLGEFEKSIVPRQRAMELLQELSRQQPNVPQFRAEMADVEAGIAYCYQCRELWKEQFDHSRQCLALWEALERDYPNEPEYARECANAHSIMANALKGEARVESAEKSVVTYARYRARFPSVPEDRVLEAHLQHWYGAALENVGRVEEAERAYRRCHELRTQCVAEQPDVPGLKTALAHIKAYLGNLFYKLERPEEALPFHQQAVALGEKILVDYPEHTGRGTDLANNYRALGQTLIMLRRHDEAEAALRRSIEIQTRMIANVPNEPMPRYRLLTTTLRLAELFEIMGRTNEAAATFRDVVEGFQQIGRESVRPTTAAWYVQDTLSQVTAFYQKQGRTAEAAEWALKLAEFERQQAVSRTNAPR